MPWGNRDRAVRATGLPHLHVGLPLGRAGCARACCDGAACSGTRTSFSARHSASRGGAGALALAMWQVHAKNRNSLQQIESALFVICLDDCRLSVRAAHGGAAAALRQRPTAPSAEWGAARVAGAERHGAPMVRRRLPQPLVRQVVPDVCRRGGVRRPQRRARLLRRDRHLAPLRLCPGHRPLAPHPPQRARALARRVHSQTAASLLRCHAVLRCVERAAESCCAPHAAFARGSGSVQADGQSRARR